MRPKGPDLNLWLVQTTRFSDIPPRFNMSHYTISEPGDRALSRRKNGHTTRFEGAMLSTLYHSRLQDILKIYDLELT